VHICSRITLLDLSNDPKVPHFSSYYTPGATAHSTYRTYTQQYSRDLADARPSPRPTGRRTQQELRHGGPSAGTYATRSAPAHPVRPPGLPTSLGASLPPQRPARTRRTGHHGGLAWGKPCLHVSELYGVLPVSTCQSSLLSARSRVQLRDFYSQSSEFRVYSSLPTANRHFYTSQNTCGKTVQNTARTLRPLQMLGAAALA
jgi:hypothetical protein